MIKPARAAAFAGGFGIVLLGLVAAGCKKAPPPAPPPPPAAPILRAPPEPPLPPISCASSELLLAAFLAEPAPATTPAAPTAAGKAAPAVKPKPAKKTAGKAPTRALRSACVVFAPGRFWLAAVLGYDEKTGKNPRLALISGSPSSKLMVFDVAPLPPAPIEKLLAESKEVNVHIRKTREDHGLVRMGISGGPDDKPDSREVGILLQLVAHQPPKILWVGDGDQVTTDAEGCIIEQAVDFELLFHTRLEQFTITKVRPGPGGVISPKCKTSPSTQESLNYQALALPPGHVFDPATLTAPATKP
jgi:hypothetical protein